MEIETFRTKSGSGPDSDGAFTVLVAAEVDKSQMAAAVTGLCTFTMSICPMPSKRVV